MVHLSGMGNLIIWMLYVVSLVMKKSSCYEILLDKQHVNGFCHGMKTYSSLPFP